ncbi:MAG: formylglycine-generating enzyme family protein [Bacteroidetes bacterium]|nr:formylglycine-generating enzyme family protein [Bacteroidota bacterium]
MKLLNSVISILIGLFIYGQTPFKQINSGKYLIGSETNLFNNKRITWIDSFSISIYEITNAEFEKFIEETGYITTAEINKDAMVFRWGLRDFIWYNDTTANWRFPNGISFGSIDTLMNHPVTTISYVDAEEYCKWSKTRLPTLNEWEIASKGNIDSKYFFGRNAQLIHQFANIWIGKSHFSNSHKDKYLFTAPVGSFKPNPNGLYDIYGNVFEFCSGYITNYDTIDDRIIHTRGGSWWCSENTCSAFNSWDIGNLNAFASFSNVGFRVCK